METIEVTLEVGLGSVTKSVVAMCLSNLTADVKNWSSDVRNLISMIPNHCDLKYVLSIIQMRLISTVNIEAALFNERTLAWEPFIEPTLDLDTIRLLPWCITISIIPVSI